jgi:cellulose synthase operon protein C
MAEFLRCRKVPGWAERVLELGARHVDMNAFKRVRAVAVLVMAIDNDAFLPSAQVPVDPENLDRAADDMKAVAEHCLDIGFADEYDLLAYITNAASLLRLTERKSECKALLRRGLERVPDEPSLRRTLALLLAEEGNRDEALEILAVCEDTDSRLMEIEILATDEPAVALEKVLAIADVEVSGYQKRMRWQLIGELALKVQDEKGVAVAVLGLREMDSTDLTADLLESRGYQLAGLDQTTVQQRLRELVGSLPVGVDMGTRWILALELRNQDLPGEAASLLEKNVDLAHRGPVATLYLQSLASARRDEAFRKAVVAAAPEVRDDPEILWAVCAHAWNLGDLSHAQEAVDALLTNQPDHPRARLLKIEILVRQDRSSELLAELDKPLENLHWTRLEDCFRVASLLGHFGHLERATAFAYRLFLEHRDKSEAWISLAGLVLVDGLGEESESACRWTAEVVGQDVAVDLHYDDGEDVFFVIEPDPVLRRLDEDSWEPEHPLVKILLGCRSGERFVGPTDRPGCDRRGERSSGEWDSTKSRGRQCT